MAEGLPTIQCPYCCVPYTDDWECLELDRLSSMTCTVCSKTFAFLIRECLACGNDSAFAWRHAPSPDFLAVLTCQSCRALFYEASEERD